jgi:catechol 2,3-dioxygenase-like lactoylglutathione lyase family enzyme
VSGSGGSLAVNHVGLTVSDLGASVAFYRDVVGMTMDDPSTRRVGGPWFDTLTWNQGADIEVAHLSLGSVQLQLVQYHAGGGGRSETGHNRVGDVHLCITVDDVEERHERIVASGAHRPTDVVDIMDTGIRSFYVEDPDGIPVEFLQP